MLSFVKIKSSDFDYIKTSDALCNPISTDCLLKVREDDTCVYFHYRKDDGIIFYVGIGGYDRPYKKICRSKWWNNEVKKHDYTIKIVHSGLSWKEACKLEIFYIAKFGRRDKGLGSLVNLTDGGDGAKGYFFTEEQRRNISIASKKKWQNPEFSQKTRKAINNVIQTSEHSEKMSKSTTELWKNPEYVEKTVNAIIEFSSTQEFKNKISEITTKNWQNPEYAEKIITAIRENSQTLEYKEKMSQITTKNWQNPEYSKKVIEAIRKFTSTPEFSEKMSQITTQIWANMSPEEREIMRQKNIEARANMTDEQKKIKAEKISKSKKESWANMTSEQRKQRGLAIKEGRRKAKEARHEKGIFTKKELKKINKKK